MLKFIFDVEVYSNFTLLGFKEFNKENYNFFEISERKNDYDEFQKFIKDKNILISFNGIHYDNIILNAVLYYKNSYTAFRKIKQVSDLIIENGDYSLFKRKKFSSVDIDLFLYWSRKERMSKQLSLKSLMAQMNMKIQELPYSPDTHLTYNEMDEVIDYNVNDLLGTEELLKRKEDEVALRFKINKNEGLRCFSWDQIKLASESLLKYYCKATGKNQKQVRNYEFENEYKKIDLNFSFKTDIFKNLLEDFKSGNTSKKILFSKNKTNVLLSYGKGGIHSVNKRQVFKTDKKFQLLTSDVASLYPNLIINYQTIRFKEVLNHYVETLNLRIKAKQKKLEKDNDLYNKFYKLVLNGVSGLIDNTYSWLYYPEGAMKLRLTGQLILTKLIEEAALNNFNVVSANTDGKLKCPSIQ